MKLNSRLYKQNLNRPLLNISPVSRLLILVVYGKTLNAKHKCLHYLNKRIN